MTAIIGAATGSIGALLGGWNFFQGLSQRRVRLKVVPKLTRAIGGGFFSSSRDALRDGFACVEVTNLSNFPVTISEVGFSLCGEVARAVVKLRDNRERAGDSWAAIACAFSIVTRFSSYARLVARRLTARH